MTEVLNHVDRGVPSNLRYTTFNSSLANSGDILLVNDSLGRPARSMTINTDTDMSIRLNVKRTVYARRQVNYHGDLLWTDHMDNLTSGMSFIDEGAAEIPIQASGTLTLSNIPISDIEIRSEAAGVWDILLT
jgi:hypothetical protein